MRVKEEEIKSKEENLTDLQIADEQANETKGGTPASDQQLIRVTLGNAHTP